MGLDGFARQPWLFADGDAEDQDRVTPEVALGRGGLAVGRSQDELRALRDA